jgi:hypothetical protein
MTTRDHRLERGAVNGWILSTIILIVLTVGAGAAATWGIINYNEQKTDVDTKTQAAVSKAVKQQIDTDEANFLKRDKEPNREFVGPEDYGRLTFDYPKTWIVYVDKDVVNTGDTFAAYLNPVSVPSVSKAATQQYALRVTIASQDYDKVLATYDASVKKGDLHSSSVSANGASGTRLDGNFSKDIRGAAVIYKIRDKTITIRTDADTFLPDFNALIATIKFNQ